MARRVVIVGAGYVGKVLARQACEAGYEVVGTTRSSETEQALAGVGASALHWDVLEDSVGPLAEQLDAETAVVYSVPTLFREYEAADGEQARHVAPVMRVLDACVEAGVERFVYLSSTSVYGDYQGAWVDEEDELSPTSPYGKMRRDIEKAVLARGGEMAANVARLVGIYGPERTMVDYIDSGRYKLVDGGQKPTNRIHVEDAAQAVLAIIERAPKQGARVYNVCDGDPRAVVELVDFLVDRLGFERPEEISLEDYAKMRGPNVAARWKNTYRCDNTRLCEELGVELAYPDVFEGYRAIFGFDR